MTKKHIFRRLLKKAILMALWTKACLCNKACPERSRMGSLLEQSMPRTPSQLRIICVNPVILSNFSSCPSCLRGEKIREISVNPWFIKDLCVCKVLYNCRETFTDVKRSLQITPFYAKRTQFPKKSNERK